jgi:IS5 family transposase
MRWAHYDSQARRSFAGIELGSEAVPDTTTLTRFHHLLERHDLTQRIFEEVERAARAKATAHMRGHAICPYHCVSTLVSLLFSPREFLKHP